MYKDFFKINSIQKKKKSFLAYLEKWKLAWLGKKCITETCINLYDFIIYARKSHFKIPWHLQDDINWNTRAHLYGFKFYKVYPSTFTQPLI